MDLNSSIISALKQIESLPKIMVGKGEEVEKTINHIFCEECGVRCTPKSKFKELELDVTYNNDTGNVFVNPCQEAPILAILPRGTQMPPDLLIIYKYRGIQIETKTSKKGNLVLNSHLPPETAIYIFNANDRNAKIRSTYFLGRDIISNKERILMESSREAMKTACDPSNKILRDTHSNWYTYHRPMFMTYERPLSFIFEEERRARVIQFVKMFDWDSKEVETNETN